MKEDKGVRVFRWKGVELIDLLNVSPIGSESTYHFSHVQFVLSRVDHTCTFRLSPYLSNF